MVKYIHCFETCDIIILVKLCKKNVQNSECLTLKKNHLIPV